MVTCLKLMLLCLCLLPYYVPPSPPPPLHTYPAVMVIYDPSLGGINCDGDCTTVATGLLTEDMWFTSGACHPDLLGLTVYFPAIDFEMKCVDNGGLITKAYNEYYQRDVVYFDVMWDASSPPEWLYWLLDWEIKYG